MKKNRIVWFSIGIISLVAFILLAFHNQIFYSKEDYFEGTVDCYYYGNITNEQIYNITSIENLTIKSMTNLTLNDEDIIKVIYDADNWRIGEKIKEALEQYDEVRSVEIYVER